MDEKIDTQKLEAGIGFGSRLVDDLYLSFGRGALDETFEGYLECIDHILEEIEGPTAGGFEGNSHNYSSYEKYGIATTAVTDITTKITQLEEYRNRIQNATSKLVTKRSKVVMPQLEQMAYDEAEEYHGGVFRKNAQNENV